MSAATALKIGDKVTVYPFPAGRTEGVVRSVRQGVVAVRLPNATTMLCLPSEVESCA